MPACCFLCSRLKEPETDFSQVVFPLHCMCAGPLFSRLAKTWPKPKRRAKRVPQGTATTSPVGKASGSRSFLDGGSFLGFVVAVLGVSNVVKTFKYFRGKGLFTYYVSKIWTFLDPPPPLVSNCHHLLQIVIHRNHTAKRADRAYKMSK